VKTIKTVKELKSFYKNGELKESDGDVVIFDKDRCELWTDKEYNFAMLHGDIAWEVLGIFNIPITDV
jgi:hypothetical protein